MTTLRRLSLLAAMVALLGPGLARGQARHVVLHYISEGPLTSTSAKRLVTYVDAGGQSMDWMFDGVILYDIGLYLASSTGPVVAYKAAVFNGQLTALADAVATARTALNDPTYKLKVYLDVCFVTGNTSASAQIADSVSKFDAFVATGRDELELAGFYWGYEENANGSLGTYMTNTGTYLRSLGRGLEMIWIPMWNAAYWSSWPSYKVDRATMQPNFPWDGAHPTTARFGAIDDYRLGLSGGSRLSGVEIEFPYASMVTNPNVPSLAECGGDRICDASLTYLNAANHYDWGQESLTTYYHGSIIITFANAGPTWRQIYDRLYGFISEHPRRSVATRLNVKVTADTMVQSLNPATNYGTAADLNLGSNSTGNANRAWLRFDDSQLLSSGTLLAAHLTATVDWWPYGSTIDDASLLLLDTPTWLESTLVWNTQPALPSAELRRLRFNSLNPLRYFWDITPTVGAMRAAGDQAVGFVLKRITEDASAHEVSLWSREDTSGRWPTIQLVYLPASTCSAGAPCAYGACQDGVIDCSTGSPVCAAGSNRPDGTACGTGKSCWGGQCVSCTPGGACVDPANPCRTGTWACGPGGATCANLVDQADGASCGPGKVCHGGSCVACAAGGACEDNQGCRTGLVSCATGSAVCANLTDAQDGSPCGTGRVCLSGACVSCSGGGACTEVCRGGTIDCTSGAPVCANLVNVADGVNCGSGRVCSGGSCVACAAGGACSDHQGCRTGLVSCATGSALCTNLTDAQNGSPCGSGQVCLSGACVSCSGGGACTEECRIGTISCTGGTPVCGNLRDADDGTPCGTGKVCRAGVCNGCVADDPCQSTDGCLAGTVSCATGSAVCADLLEQPDGTSCGASRVCSSGVCTACAVGQPCSAVDGCRTGTVDCATGQPVCANLVDRPAGYPCNGSDTCEAGACHTCPAGASCLSADACQQGTVDCSGSAPRCSGLSALADGTACGASRVCSAGRCVSCTAGASCTSTDGCSQGKLDCASGAPACKALSAVEDGTPCGGGACQAGACRAGSNSPVRGSCGCAATSAGSGLDCGLVLAVAAALLSRRRKAFAAP